MSRFVVVHTSWYQEYINEMKEIILEELAGLKVNFYEVPGSLELAAMGKITLDEGQAYDDSMIGNEHIGGIIFCGVVVMGRLISLFIQYDMFLNSEGERVLRAKQHALDHTWRDCIRDKMFYARRTQAALHVPKWCWKPPQSFV